MQTVTGFQCGTGKRYMCPHRYTCDRLHEGEKVGDPIPSRLPASASLPTTTPIPHSNDVPPATDVRNKLGNGEEITVHELEFHVPSTPSPVPQFSQGNTTTSADRSLNDPCVVEDEDEVIINKNSTSIITVVPPHASPISSEQDICPSTVAPVESDGVNQSSKAASTSITAVSPCHATADPIECTYCVTKITEDEEHVQCAGCKTLVCLCCSKMSHQYYKESIETGIDTYTCPSCVNNNEDTHHHDSLLDGNFEHPSTEGEAPIANLDGIKPSANLTEGRPRRSKTFSRKKS